jgi:hypothetical protein
MKLIPITHNNYYKKLIMKGVFLILFFSAVFSATILKAQETKFPIKVSENNRFLVDQNNNPFFYQADTPWLIFLKMKPAEMEQLMDIRFRQGFNVLQTTALPAHPDKPFDISGEMPFHNNDFSLPNEKYWTNIRNGVLLAGKKGFLVGIVPAWKGCCGGNWNQVILDNGTAKCRLYGQFLGKFFAGCENLFWIQGGDNDPQAHTDHYREIAMGIAEFMPHVLQTYHASSGHSSSDVMNYLDHSWMNFSWTYTYFPEKYGVWIYIMGWNALPHVYQMNHIEYRKYPLKPFVLGESQYEGEDSSSYSPLQGQDVVRRQAYWSVLSGGCGHAYGSWNWSIKKDWRKVEFDPGANQMKYVRNFFESFPWFKLVPDLDRKIIHDGEGTYGKDDFVVAAGSPDKSIVCVYIPPTGIEKRNFTISAEFCSKKSKCKWYNPFNGEYTIAEKEKNSKDFFSFTSPGENGSDFNDWILLIEN